MTHKLPARVYSQYARLLKLPGSDSGFHTLQDELVPVQDMSRVMQADLVQRTLYTTTQAPAASTVTDIQWAEASDWTEVQVNGILSVDDAALPQVTDDRIITMAGLRISGTAASYNSSQALRTMPTASGADQLTIAEWGAIVTGHDGPTMAGLFMFPQFLTPGEDTVRLDQEVSADLAVFHFMFQMVSAEPGVLARYPGL